MTQGKTGYWFRSLYVLPRHTQQTEICEWWRVGREQRGWKRGRVHLRLQLLWGISMQHSNKPPNLRALNQTHFLSHTLMASSFCHERMFSVLPMSFPVQWALPMHCGSYIFYRFIENIPISKLWGVDVIRGIGPWLQVPEMPLQVWCADWPDVNFLYALAVGIWFSDGKTCQRKSMEKAKRILLSLMLYFSFEDDTDTAVWSGGCSAGLLQCCFWWFCWNFYCW